MLYEKINQYVANNSFVGGELIIPFAVNSELRSSPRFFEIMIEIIMNFIKFSSSVTAIGTEEYDGMITNLIQKSAFYKNGNKEP